MPNKPHRKEEAQYVEAISVNGAGHTVMDCSGT